MHISFIPYLIQKASNFERGFSEDLQRIFYVFKKKKKKTDVYGTIDIDTPGSGINSQRVHEQNFVDISIRCGTRCRVSHFAPQPEASPRL